MPKLRTHKRNREDTFDQQTVYKEGPFTQNRGMRRAGRGKPILVLAYVDLGTEDDPNVRLVKMPSGEIRPLLRGPGYTRKMRKGRRT